MTWSLVSVVSFMGGAWLGPRVPQFGMLVAQKRYGEMDRIFWKLTLIVTGIAIFGAAAIWLLVFGLNYYNHFLAHRLLSPLTTGLFLIATIIHTSSMSMSTYLRAHKKEPLVFISVLLGCLVGLSTLLLGKYYSALGMAIGYLTIYALVFPIIVLIWRRCRRRWHYEFQ